MRWIAGLAVVLVGCAAATSDGAQTSAAAATEATSDDPIARSEIPEAQAFTGWTEDTQLVEPPRPQDAPRVAIACDDQHLFPTHPASDRKRYHRSANGHYDQFKVDGDSDVCKIKGTVEDPSTGLLRCALATELQYIVLSDTFEDGCGHLYRGFWATTFLTSDENMGTLMSLGRTVYQVPNAEFAGEMYDGATYAVDAKQLLIVSPLFTGDADAVATDRQKVIDAGTHRYDAATHLWQYLGPR